MISTDYLVKKTGLTYRQVDYWARQGYLRTDPTWEGGTGRARSFLDGELTIATRMRDLLGCGFVPAAATKLARGDREAFMRLDLTLAAIRAMT